MKKTASAAVLALCAALLIIIGVAPAQATTSVPTNVGVPSGTSLTAHSGDLTVSTDNTVVDSLDITGRLIISANTKNVLVTRTKIRSTAHTGNGIDMASGTSAMFVDDTIIGFSNSVSGGNYQASGLDVSDMADDGFKVGENTHIFGSYCHAVYVTAGAHSDCAQIQAGVTNASITNNYFDATGGNSALFIAPDLGPSSYGGVIVSGNYFNGGNYSAYSVDGSGGTYILYEVVFVDNKWGNTHTYNYENIARVASPWGYNYGTNVRDDTGAGV